MTGAAPAPGTTGAFPAQPDPFYYRLGRKLGPWLDRILAKYSVVGDPPVFDTAKFPWTRHLEANWSAIRDEVQAVLASDPVIPPLAEISPDHEAIADPTRWRSFFLWGYGYRHEVNCARCPETAKALQAVPGLNSAFFSILAPGTHIPRHTGVSKIIMTCHLGLVVPKQYENCKMEVHDQMVIWRDGKCAVFDDTYEHEVWNNTDETRVVLLIQFKRPLRQPGKFLGSLFLNAVRYSPFVQDAKRNLADWERAHKIMEH